MDGRTYIHTEILDDPEAIDARKYKSVKKHYYKVKGFVNIRPNNSTSSGEKAGDYLVQKWGGDYRTEDLEQKEKVKTGFSQDQST